MIAAAILALAGWYTADAIRWMLSRPGWHIIARIVGVAWLLFIWACVCDALLNTP